MSEVSGLELAEQIAAHYPETHLVIMSGYRDFDYAQQALRYEAFDYLLKPIEITQLAETFEKLGKRIQEQQEMRHLKGLIPDIETLFRKRLRDNDSGIDSALQELPQNSRLTAEETAFLAGGEKEKTKYTYSIIHRVQRYVEENYQRDLTLSEIAETVFLSPVYFCRLFKELTGLNFLTYLTNHRMEKAKELLVTNQYKIGEVGQLVGYNNTKYFTRVFKKHCGVTPSDYIHRELLDD
ncbi:helix-turn-helix domain-containing protein [Oceanispirochaeta sp. M2]|nr:helix-turn-helix domain-containing protein [Oceanispirochaeta sp. M2]NPD70862.1 helix-turn-helix domain-containing protein [Oceanispirochaeta sp. M1]